MKIYTRTGDKGQTSLFGGERVEKSHTRVQAYGTLDELNSQIGLCISILKSTPLASQKKSLDLLLQTQRDLFAIGSWLASREASERVSKGEEAFAGDRKNRTHIDEKNISSLENAIDSWEEKLEPMKTFILPGGSLLASHIHMARTICRRAERETIIARESGELIPDLAIQYLNRLADALFVFSRFVNFESGVKEDPWQ